MELTKLKTNLVVDFDPCDEMKVVKQSLQPIMLHSRSTLMSFLKILAIA